MQNVDVPGFGDGQIQVQLSNGFNTTKVYLNGQPAPIGPKRGTFLLRRADGREVTASFRPTFPDPIPLLVIDGQPYHLVAPLKWYQWLWAAFPILLLFIGGAIGGGLGAGATFLNAQILRSNQPPVVRYLVSGLVSLGAVAIFFLLASLLQTVMPGTNTVRR